MNYSLLAMEAQENVIVMTNFERAFPDDGFARELDSLATLVADKTFGKDNEYVISWKFICHWWGHDNRDFIQMAEVKSWDDVTKADQKADELFEKDLPTQETRDEFNDAYNKYFTDKHSDEVYREVIFGK